MTISNAIRYDKPYINLAGWHCAGKSNVIGAKEPAVCLKIRVVSLRVMAVFAGFSASRNGYGVFGN